MTSSMLNFAPMAKVAALQAGPFAPVMTAAQARAAQMTDAERDTAKAKIGVTAKSFEAQFVATMMGDMFNGVDLGGGQGADAFKSILMDAIGKKIVAGVGVGLARQVQAEMLKMQGLS